eukprot:6213454-Pleurochrysis_carterae.AAC.1
MMQSQLQQKREKGEKKARRLQLLQLAQTEEACLSDEAAAMVVELKLTYEEGSDEEGNVWEHVAQAYHLAIEEGRRGQNGGRNPACARGAATTFLLHR